MMARLTRYKNLRFIANGVSEFRNWQSSAQLENEIEVSFARFRENNSSKFSSIAQIRAAFDGFVKDAFVQDRPISLRMDDNYKYSGLDIRSNFKLLSIVGDRDYQISGKMIGTLNLEGHQKIVLSDCYINSFTCNHYGPVIIKNCHIGELKFSNTASRHFEMIGGGLYGLICADATNPFAGPVIFKDVFIPRDQQSGISTQHLRNIRKHLSAMNNLLSAGIFHSAELALDRIHERLPSKFFSWFYEVISDYGNNVTRPLLWLFAFISATMLAVYGFDGVTLAKSDDAEGWQLALTGSEPKSQILRAVVYPFTSILNPLSMFSKPILIAKTEALAALLVLLSFLSTTSLFFLVLAIRRRFKLE